ncbi:hypothetical protein LSAT2_023280 [Lamellibrachia satsuma]|nr:hypothetical protein LSAT2_023280 [Lamellibrachia satsuma]
MEKMSTAPVLASLFTFDQLPLDGEDAICSSSLQSFHPTHPENAPISFLAMPPHPAFGRRSRHHLLQRRHYSSPPTNFQSTEEMLRTSSCVSETLLLH